MITSKSRDKKIVTGKREIKTIGCLNRGFSVLQPIKNKRT